MTDFSQLIGEQTKVPAQLVADALKFAHIRFRKIRIPKRSGGYRTAVQPAAELKLVHHWVSSEILEKLPVSSVATAFKAGSSILLNASTHKSSLYSVRVDIKDFFPSITCSDFERVVKANSSILPNFVRSPEFPQFIGRACFDSKGRLPIGYSTSPAIANLVMFDLDVELTKIVSDSTRFGHAKITRYADDFVFSTNKVGACRDFVDSLTLLLSTNTSPTVALNPEKTRYMSRKGGSTLVTGLRICQDGSVRVHQNYRDHVRLLLKLFAAGLLSSDDVPKLVGHMAFIENADPKLFTRLSFRYFEEIARIRARA